MKKFFVLTFLALFLIGGLIYFYKWERETENRLLLFGNVDVRLVDIGFRVNGRITSLLREEGDLVMPGALIATLDEEPYGDELKRAESALLAAKLKLDNDESLFKRRESLAPLGGVSLEDYDNAKYVFDASLAAFLEAKSRVGIAKTNLSDTKTYAPARGIILTRIREPGSVVKAADPVCTISISDPVWVRCFIGEPLLGVVFPGMKAEIHTDTARGKIYKGQVGFISPVAEFTPKNVETTELRTDLVYRLRVIVENPDLGLLQGMPVTVKLLPPEKIP